MKLSYFDLALLFSVGRLGDNASGLALRDELRRFDNMLPQLFKINLALNALRRAGFVSVRRSEDSNCFRLTETGRAALAI